MVSRKRLYQQYSKVALSRYEIAYYDGTYITFNSNRVIVVNGMYIFECVVNVPSSVPDGTDIFSVPAGVSGNLLLTQPHTGETYPIVVNSDGGAKAWGVIPAASNCFLTGILNDYTGPKRSKATIWT